MNKEIKEQLIKIAHPEGKDFQKRIVNTNYPILGSRMNEIRKLAKDLSKDIDLMVQDEDSLYEEVLLRGLILAYQKESILNKVPQIKKYLETIDSWALCDSFCSTFAIKQRERQPLFEILITFLNSDKAFEQRFALIMFLSHYLKFTKEGEKLKRPRQLALEHLKDRKINSTYLKEILPLVDKPYKEYYSSMGAAWLIAEAFLFFPKEILDFIDECHLDNLTKKRTLDKIRQSNIPDKKIKNLIKSLY